MRGGPVFELKPKSISHLPLNLAVSPDGPAWSTGQNIGFWFGFSFRRSGTCTWASVMRQETLTKVLCSKVVWDEWMNDGLYSIYGFWYRINNVSNFILFNNDNMFSTTNSSLKLILSLWFCCLKLTN